MRTLHIIDTFGIFFRDFYGTSKANLRNSEGFPTGLLNSFAELILGLYKKNQKDYIVFALESNNNFRKDIYPLYKANRVKAPDDIKEQIKVAISWIEQMGLKSISIDGYEADDIIASINKTMQKEQNLQIRIISSDKDLNQLIGGNTFRYNPKDKKEIREEQCLEKYGITPSQFIDYQSLVGDSSDNVPGAKQIGPQTAAPLLQEFKSLDGIYANLDKIAKPRTKELLIASKENVYISQQLVKLKDDLLPEFSLECCLMPVQNPLLNIIDSLEKYELKNILKKISKQTFSIESYKNVNKNSLFKFCDILLDSNKKLQNILEKIKEDSTIAFDTETTDLDAIKAKIVGFSFSLNGVESYYVPIAHSYLGINSQVSKPFALSAIQKIFNAKEVIGHNIKYDLEILKSNFNFTPKNYKNIKDSMILAWLYNSDAPCGLDFLMESYFKHKMISFDNIVKKGENFSQVAIENASIYACEDSAASYQLYKKLESMLPQSLLKLAESLEFPFIECLVNMELSGATIDIAHFSKLKEEISIKLQNLSKEIYTLANKPFNLNSPQQLSIVLFNELNLQSDKKVKTHLSTSHSVLESLRNEHPIIPKILEYRELFKLFSTYVEPLISYASLNESHKIYTSFLQTGTSTGRLSSNNPNLQNIPVKTTQGRRIREGFIAKNGYSLISLDYSQIELRLLAHFSQDSALIEAFYKNADIHLETAKKLFGEAQAEQKRQIAKSINFGLIYGMGSRKLSETLQISQLEAKEYIQSYFESFPTVKEFLKNQEEFILQNGYSLTLLGRMRKFNFKNTQEFQKAANLREGINAIFQGSAADIIKLAMLKITQSNLQSNLILQVHDELIFETPKQFLELESKKIVEIMENIISLKVPLKCSINIAKNWGDLK